MSADEGADNASRRAQARNADGVLDHHFALWLSPVNLNFALSELLAVGESLGEDFSILPWSTDVPLHNQSVAETERARKLYKDGCDASERVHDADWPEWQFQFVHIYVPNGLPALERICARCLAIKAAWQIWAEGDSIPSIIQQSRRQDRIAQRRRYAGAETSFRLDPVTVHWTVEKETRKGWIHDVVDALQFDGPIKMREADLSVGLVIYYPPPPDGVTKADLGDPRMRPELFILGKALDCELGRDRIETYDVKKRLYIGNTTMESEMSLRMSLMAQALPGKLIYDPFAGTGSILHTSAAYGAHTLGTELDGRNLRGSSSFADFSASRMRFDDNPGTPPPSAAAAAVPSFATGLVETAKAYGLQDRILDTAVMDFTQMGWRRSIFDSDGLFDAIVTDRESPLLSHC